MQLKEHRMNYFLKATQHLYCSMFKDVFIKYEYYHDENITEWSIYDTSKKRKIVFDEAHLEFIANILKDTRSIITAGVKDNLSQDTILWEIMMYLFDLIMKKAPETVKARMNGKEDTISLLNLDFIHGKVFEDELKDKLNGKFSTTSPISLLQHALEEYKVIIRDQTLTDRLQSIKENFQLCENPMLKKI